MSKWNQCQQWLAVGQPLPAIQLLRKQLAKSDRDAEGWFLLGCAHQMLNELDDAEKALRRSVALNAKPVAPRLNLAGVLLDRFKFEESEKLLAKLRHEAKHLPLVWRYSAKLRLQQERWTEALDAYEQLFQLTPDDVQSRFEYALQADTCKRATEALLLLETKPVSGLTPEELAGWRAYLGFRAGVRSAESACEALTWEPTDVEGLSRRTGMQVLVLASAGQFDSVVAILEALFPHFPRIADEMGLTLGMCQLGCGNWRDGWKGYSDRPNARGRQIEANSFGRDIPLWQGESIEGKTLLVHCEQGAGDVIQFMRFLPLLEKQGVQLRLNMDPGMLRLFAGKDAAETEYEAVGAAATENCDYQVRLLDIPWCMGLDRDVLPLDIPYLQVESSRREHWQERLASIQGPKIALVWAGNPNHLADVYRSAALADFEALFALPGVTWLSVQKGAGAREARSLPWVKNFVDLGPEINDFQDTAAILEQADLLISVDTSVAHLAGAMNRPVWTLISSRGQDWRWEMNSSDTPWYPSMRLWRQKENESWNEMAHDRLLPALAGFFDLPAEDRSTMTLEALVEFDRLFNLGNLESCRDVILPVIAQNPDCASAYFRLAQLEDACGEHQQARANLEQALDIAPRFAEAWRFKAKLAAKNSKEALFCWQRALFFSSDLATTLSELAEYCETLGAFIAAQDCREAATGHIVSHEK